MTFLHFFLDFQLERVMNKLTLFQSEKPLWIKNFLNALNPK